MNFDFDLIIALPVIIIVIPMAIGAAALGELGAANNVSIPIILGAACYVLYFPILPIINGMFKTCIQSAWTLAFMRLITPQNNAPVFVTENAQ